MVLKPEAYDTWLDPQMASTHSLTVMLREQSRTEFASRPVSPAVNAARHNSPACIDPLFDRPPKSGGR